LGTRQAATLGRATYGPRAMVYGRSKNVWQGSVVRRCVQKTSNDVLVGFLGTHGGQVLYSSLLVYCTPLHSHPLFHEQGCFSEPAVWMQMLYNLQVPGLPSKSTFDSTRLQCQDMMLFPELIYLSTRTDAANEVWASSFLLRSAC
jgi:hypothetical protein